MPKEESMEVQGKITDVLPNGMFRVELQTGHEILAHLSGKLRIRHVKIVKGDRVTAEVSPYDLTQGTDHKSAEA